MSNVGDDAFASFGRFGQIDVRRGVITKVSPTGQITVDFGVYTKRFKGAWEIGAGSRGGTLIDEKTFNRMKVEQAQENAMKAVRDFIYRMKFSDKAELLEKLEELSALANEIPDNLRERK